MLSEFVNVGKELVKITWAFLPLSPDRYASEGETVRFGERGGAVGQVAAMNRFSEVQQRLAIREFIPDRHTNPISFKMEGGTG